MKLRRPRGLQLEIVTSLFVVMLAGLGIVAVVMVSLAARTIESAALGRLRTGAEALEQRLESAPQRLGDVAPLAHLQAPRIEGASFRVLDERGAAFFALASWTRSLLTTYLGVVGFFVC